MVNFQLRVYTSAPKGQSFYHPEALAPQQIVFKNRPLNMANYRVGRSTSWNKVGNLFFSIGELGITEEYVASLVLLGGRAGEPGHQKGSGVGTWSYGDAYFIPGRQKHGRKELSFSEGLLNKANVWCCYWSLPSPALTGTWYWYWQG